MKKISRDERRGALVLVAVILLVISGCAFLRFCSSRQDARSSPHINVIYPESSKGTDGYSEDNYSDDYSDYKAKTGKRGSKKRKGKTSGRKSNKTMPQPARDYLGDTIPVYTD